MQRFHTSSQRTILNIRKWHRGAQSRLGIDKLHPRRKKKKSHIVTLGQSEQGIDEQENSYAAKILLHQDASFSHGPIFSRDENASHKQARLHTRCSLKQRTFVCWVILVGGGGRVEMRLALCNIVGLLACKQPFQDMLRTGRKPHYGDGLVSGHVSRLFHSPFDYCVLQQCYPTPKRGNNGTHYEVLATSTIFFCQKFYDEKDHSSF